LTAPPTPDKVHQLAKEAAMEVSKQQFISVQLTYKETLDALEQYVRHKIWSEKGEQPLVGYKVEDYDPDTSRSGGEKGAFFLFLREQ